MIRDTLLHQIGLCHYTIHRNMEGIDDEASLERVGAGGNCANWVLGHIVATRRRLLDHLGGEHPLSTERAARYVRGSDPLGPGSEALTIDELTRVLDATQDTIRELLPAQDDAFFEQQVPDLFDDQKTQSRGQQLATIIFHETYHAGQLGVIRHAIGREPAIV